MPTYEYQCEACGHGFEARQSIKAEPMKELVILSGKGGTGKTSVTASFAVLARHAVLADCDVDASDLHLVLSPEVRERHEFRSGREAVIVAADCMGCGACLAYCRFDAIIMNGHAAGESPFRIDPIACEGCGVCAQVCPAKAVDLRERHCGEWMISETRRGPMVHARLHVGGENSGKLVTLVRQAARRIAEADGRSLVLVDGPPGIGCPVIASLTGATDLLVVSEPTVSGEHDLLRVLALARHFHLPAAIAVNKWDLSPEMTVRIEARAADCGARVLGRIRYDDAVTRAQLQARAVVEFEGGAADDVRALWQQLNLEA